MNNRRICIHSRDRVWVLSQVGLAAPVDKVFEIITGLKAKMPQPEDQKALSWTMDLIAKEELYKVNLDSRSSHMGMGHLTAEMTDWLRANLQVTAEAHVASVHPPAGMRPWKLTSRRVQVNVFSPNAVDKRGVSQVKGDRSVGPAPFFVFPCFPWDSSPPQHHVLALAYRSTPEVY